MKYAVLLLVLLLPACAADQPWRDIFRKPAGAAQENRKVDSKPKATETQRPADTQQPARDTPGEVTPRKREHNIEED